MAPPEEEQPEAEQPAEWQAEQPELPQEQVDFPVFFAFTIERITNATVRIRRKLTIIVPAIKTSSKETTSLYAWIKNGNDEAALLLFVSSC